jgi:glycogen operon protein
LIENGTPERLGAGIQDGGANFAVYAPDADGIELCLFDESGDETVRIELPARTGGVWHGFVPGIGAGQHYGFRAHGVYDAEAGFRFNPSKLLIDPYAQCLSGQVIWCDAVFDFVRGGEQATLVRSHVDSAPFMPKSVVYAAHQAAASRCQIRWPDTVIYELNVRGFTMRHPAISGQERGRLGALSSEPLLQHFKALGITSVELMPIHAFVDEEFLASKGQRNLWGYNSVGFFAPDARFLGSDGVGSLRHVVQALHAANIEVVLDVVYNHTAEGGRLGPTFSFRGLANSSYYRLAAGSPDEYINDSGCGNTINTDHPIVRRLIVDSLCYWVREFGIDGFRFDLATILGRTPDGFSRKHPLFEQIRQTPELSDIKLIAEPWDVGPGGYQLGAFPVGWAEWNDQYRDTIRRFWGCESGIAPDLARRVHGSADIFEASGRGPPASVNFVASHDGFTMADAVSYVERHNEANGEQNRDGHAHNFGVNHGIEGVSDDPGILAIRRRHRLNLLATLLFSQGTPMLSGGDEFGNSQTGNNNAYAQDNDTGWIDWTGLAADPQFFAEVCVLIRLRQSLPLLGHSVYRHGERTAATGRADIEWFNALGAAIPEDQWPDIASLGILLSRAEDDPASGIELAVFILFNVNRGDCDFLLPAIDAAGRWTCRYSTDGSDRHSIQERSFRAAGFSIACLTYDPH